MARRLRPIASLALAVLMLLVIVAMAPGWLNQINGCAYCLDMHSKDARANGESEQRLYGLDSWRETPYYSARERAALEWTEAMTLISETHASDDVYERVREQFSEDELAHLTLAIVAINGWNRLNIAARTVPGDYVVGSLAKLHVTHA